MKRAALIFFGLTAALGAASAGEPEHPTREQLRARLSALRAEEQRLERVLADAKRGVVAAVATGSPASSVVLASTNNTNAPTTPDGAAFHAIPDQEQVDFERARVESLRARVERARKLAADRPVVAAPRTPLAPVPLSPRSEPALESTSNNSRVAQAQTAPIGSRANASARGQVALAPADALRFADACLAAGDLDAAERAYSDAVDAASKASERRANARARYGRARVLEKLGRTDEALGEYSALPMLPEAGEWGRAAAFARRFIEWRRKLDAKALPEVPKELKR